MEVIPKTYTKQERFVVVVQLKVFELLLFRQSTKNVVYFGLFEQEYQLSKILGTSEPSLDFQRQRRPHKYSLFEVNLVFYIQFDVSKSIFVQKNNSLECLLRSFSPTFFGGHKNNFRFQFGSSFNMFDISNLCYFYEPPSKLHIHLHSFYKYNGDHLFSTYAKFFDGNIFYSLIRTRSCAYQGVQNVNFQEKSFAYVFNE